MMDKQSFYLGLLPAEDASPLLEMIRAHPGFTVASAVSGGDKTTMVVLPQHVPRKASSALQIRLINTDLSVTAKSLADQLASNAVAVVGARVSDDIAFTAFSNLAFGIVKGERGSRCRS